ncbi:hypothetical protein ACWCPF_43830 [Streptomyces sp. NPDC001858]
MPGIEQHAEAAAENACHLADTTAPESWSATAADDALDAIDTLAGALSALGPDVAAALAPVMAATADGTPPPRTGRRRKDSGHGGSAGPMELRTAFPAAARTGARVQRDPYGRLTSSNQGRQPGR